MKFIMRMQDKDLGVADSFRKNKLCEWQKAETNACISTIVTTHADGSSDVIIADVSNIMVGDIVNIDHSNGAGQVGGRHMTVIHIDSATKTVTLSVAPPGSLSGKEISFMPCSTWDRCKSWVENDDEGKSAYTAWVVRIYWSHYLWKRQTKWFEDMPSQQTRPIVRLSKDLGCEKAYARDTGLAFRKYERNRMLVLRPRKHRLTSASAAQAPASVSASVLISDG